MADRKRSVCINIRVTPDEKRHYQLCAQRCNLSLSEYLRRLASGRTLEEKNWQPQKRNPSIYTTEGTENDSPH